MSHLQDALPQADTSKLTLFQYTLPSATSHPTTSDSDSDSVDIILHHHKHQYEYNGVDSVTCEDAHSLDFTLCSQTLTRSSTSASDSFCTLLDTLPAVAANVQDTFSPSLKLLELRNKLKLQIEYYFKQALVPLSDNVLPSTDTMDSSLSASPCLRTNPALNLNHCEYSSRSYLGREMKRNGGWLSLQTLARMPKLIQMFPYAEPAQRLSFLTHLVRELSSCPLHPHDCSCTDRPAFVLNTQATHLRPRQLLRPARIAAGDTPGLDRNRKSIYVANFPSSWQIVDRARSYFDDVCRRFGLHGLVRSVKRVHRAGPRTQRSSSLIEPLFVEFECEETAQAVLEGLLPIVWNGEKEQSCDQTWITLERMSKCEYIRRMQVAYHERRMKNKCLTPSDSIIDAQFQSRWCIWKNYVD